MKMFYTKIENYTPFIEKKKKDFNRSSILCNIKAPFELLHADVAHIHFFQNQQPIQLMFYLLLIYSLLKFILIQ